MSAKKYLFLALLGFICYLVLALTTAAPGGIENRWVGVVAGFALLGMAPRIWKKNFQGE